MCGICGIVAPERSGRRLDVALVDRMRDAIAHRGPDGVGRFLEEGVALGHRRLSIVDVAHGAQPMASDDGALQIVYNGEVFNHPALSAELQAKGVKYHTHCDTETVLHVFERERERTPEKLRGMFAFAVWDRRRRELVIARDRFGVKPLYYVHAADGTLFFASEIKALVAAGAVTPELDYAQLPDYLANHAPSGDETLFRGVRRLPAGHTLTWRDGAITLRRYWDLDFPPAEEARDIDAKRERELVDEYHERLREAVRLRLMADVPLGAFLSGGIDSAAITALMSELTGGGVETFSVAFAEREANELHWARLVAEKFNTRHHEIVVSPQDFWSAVPRLVWHEDEPMAHPSSVALNFVSRLAAERVKVVLTGEGSDETLAGYGRYRKTVLNVAAGRAYERVTPRLLRRAVRGSLGALPAGVRAKARRTFVAMDANLDALYFDNFAVFGRDRQPSLLTRQARDRIGAGVDPYAAHHAALALRADASLLDQLLYADTKTYLHELLMKQDQMSMAASIESRVPFLDHPLVEFAARMPERMKLRGGTTKWVLREAMKNTLPSEILTRGKMGFPVPVGAWLRGPYRGIVDDVVLGDRALARGIFEPAALRRLAAEHMAGVDHAERLWSLVNLELWHRVFVDGEGPDAAMPGLATGHASSAAGSIAAPHSAVAAR